MWIDLNKYLDDKNWRWIYCGEELRMIIKFVVWICGEESGDSYCSRNIVWGVGWDGKVRIVV